MIVVYYCGAGESDVSVVQQSDPIYPYRRRVHQVAK